MTPWLIVAALYLAGAVGTYGLLHAAIDYTGAKPSQRRQRKIIWTCVFWPIVSAVVAYGLAVDCFDRIKGEPT
jgi:nitrate reductase NapE component